jgi:DNA-binding NtrC family response regulator
VNRSPSPICLLVVDDETDFAEALVSRLTRRGFTASAVFSGQDAVEALRTSAYSAVVLDLRMPGMDGLAVLQEIRRLDPRLPVVILTGHGTVASGIEGMQLGATDFLQKPVPIETLCDVIRAAVERADEPLAAAKKDAAR